MVTESTISQVERKLLVLPAFRSYSHPSIERRSIEEINCDCYDNGPNSVFLLLLSHNYTARKRPPCYELACPSTSHTESLLPRPASLRVFYPVQSKRPRSLLQSQSPTQSGRLKTPNNGIKQLSFSGWFYHARF
jgi:hypothetical protein